MDQTKTAKDVSLAHQATWMLIIDNPALVKSISPNAGENSLPMTLKVTHAGKDSQKHIYSNLTVKEFLVQMSELSGIALEKLKAEHLEDYKTTRIDLLLYYKETLKLPEELRTLNTMRATQVAHMSRILISEKDETEEN